MKDFKRSILILFTVLFLSACSDEVATDESCIDQIEELTITGEPCKSLDVGYLMLKTQDTTRDFNPSYSANDYLTSDQASFQNKLEEQKNNLGIYSHSLKSLFKDNILNLYLVSIMVSIFIFVKMIKKEEEQQILTFAVLMMMTITIIKVSVDSEILTTPVAKTAIYSGNLITSINQKALLQEKRQVDDLVLKYSPNEALVDVSDLIKMNVCLSNNMKSALRKKEEALKPFNSLDEMKEYYHLKNQPFIQGVDARNGKKIAYKLNENGFLNSIEFAECGSVTFPSSQIDYNTYSLMKDLGFKYILHSAITEKSFSSSLSKLKESYDEGRGGSNVERNKQFLKLLDIFTIEYKKGLIFGSVETDYNAQPSVLSSDFTHLTTLLNSADVVYNNIVASGCYKNGSYVDDTIKAIEKYDETKTLFQYSCTEISDEVKSVIPKGYSYFADRALIESKISLLQEDTSSFALEMAQTLIKDYETTNKAFVDMLNTLDDFSKDLAYYKNKGVFGAGEFYKYFNNNQSKYLQRLARIADVNRIDYSQSLPDFTNDTFLDVDVPTDIFTVRVFTQDLEDEINLNVKNINNNITNDLVEYSLDNSSFKQDDVLVSENTFVDQLDTYLEDISTLYSSVKSMTCSGNRDECEEQLKDFDGVEKYTTFANSLTETGAKSLVGSTIAYIGIAQINGATEWKNTKAKDGASFGKGSNKPKMLKGVNKTNILKGVATVAETTAKTMAYLGLGSVILGNVMLSVFEFQSIVITWFIQAMIIYLTILPFLLIMIGSVGVMTNYDVKGYTKTLSLMFQTIAYPIVVSISLSLILFLSSYLTVFIMNIIPYISMTFMDESTTGIIDNILNSTKAILFIIVIVIGLSILFIKILLEKFSQVMEETFDTVFDHTETILNKSQTVIVATSALGAQKLLKSKPFEKIKKATTKDKKEEDNKE